MIVSHKLKLIFIHIPKNAGTFIWTLLKRLDDDIVVYFNTKDSSRKTLHNKVKDIKDLCEFDYSEYNIFCVVRDPVERIKSLYNYISINKDYPTHDIVKSQSFREFIEYKFSNIDFLETNYIGQCQFMYDENNNLLINTIIRYENLHKELKIMLGNIEVLKDKIEEIEEYMEVRINESPKRIIEIDRETIELLKNIEMIHEEKKLLKY
jgi:hypothetical protein